MLFNGYSQVVLVGPSTLCYAKQISNARTSVTVVLHVFREMECNVSLWCHKNHCMCQDLVMINIYVHARGHFVLLNGYVNATCPIAYWEKNAIQ